MVIVSQDQNVIINFNNVCGIQRDKKLIGTKLVGEDSLILGIYSTEERAKEVLKKILQKIEDTSIVNLMDNLQISIHDPNFGGSLSSVFYMPED